MFSFKPKTHQKSPRPLGVNHGLLRKYVRDLVHKIGVTVRRLALTAEADACGYPRALDAADFPYMSMSPIASTIRYAN